MASPRGQRLLSVALTAALTTVPAIALLAPTALATSDRSQAPGPPGSLSGARTAVDAGADDDADHVTVVRPQPDGGVELTLYRTAPGVSAAQLADALISAGEPVVKPGRRPTPDPFNCYLGTAYALDSGRCPPIRWTWGGYDDPQVYFRDLTPNHWPVREAVNDWNRAVGVDSYWTSGGCPGGSRHCVEVRAGNYGASGWSGSTTYTINFGRNFVEGSVKIKLNDRYATSAADRRTSTCHELGHALGVGHNISRASCMYAQDTRDDPRVPHSSDYNLLKKVIYP